MGPPCSKICDDLDFTASCTKSGILALINIASLFDTNIKYFNVYIDNIDIIS